MITSLAVEFKFSREVSQDEVIKQMREHFQDVDRGSFFEEIVLPELEDGEWDGRTAQYVKNQGNYQVQFYFFTDLRSGGFSVKNRG